MLRSHGQSVCLLVKLGGRAKARWTRHPPQTFEATACPSGYDEDTSCTSQRSSRFLPCPHQSSRFLVVSVRMTFVVLLAMQFDCRTLATRMLEVAHANGCRSHRHLNGRPTSINKDLHHSSFVDQPRGICQPVHTSGDRAMLSEAVTETQCTLTPLHQIVMARCPTSGRVHASHHI